VPPAPPGQADRLDQDPHADGVRWTSPAGRTWLSPHQHTAPAVSTRQPAPPPATTGDEHLSPLEHEDLLWTLDPSSPLLDGAFTPTAPVQDHEPDHDDHALSALLHDLTRWTLDLDDPHTWSSPPVLVEEPSAG
jgi:hypothetical protein